MTSRNSNKTICDKNTSTLTCNSPTSPSPSRSTNFNSRHQVIFTTFNNNTNFNKPNPKSYNSSHQRQSNKNFAKTNGGRALKQHQAAREAPPNATPTNHLTQASASANHRASNQNLSQQQPSSGRSSNSMAHYKFHNDCQSKVLKYEQVKRLDFVMDQTVPIHGRGNFPTLYIKLKELIRLVKHKLQNEHSVEVRDIRLNGGAASYVLAPENSHYNDFDLIFGIDLSHEDRFDVIRDVVLDCLKEFYPKDYSQTHERSGESEAFSQQHQTTSNLDVDNQSRPYGARCDEPTTTNSDFDLQAHSYNDCKSQSGKLNMLIESVVSENDDSCIEDESKKECSLPIGSYQADKGIGVEDVDLGGKQVARLLQNQQQQQRAYQMPLNSCAIKEAYVHKMVKVNDDDRWSLISLGVQQSEVTCCGQANCSSSAQQISIDSHHIVDSGSNQQQYLVTVLGNENDPSRGPTSNGAQGISTYQMENLPVAASCKQGPMCRIYHHQHNDDQDQPRNHQPSMKQFPNSIELKFVDRMRRKFEFSVDSFQIILDSLIQFYDYAPQSTIASRRLKINSHPSSTMINTRPLVTNNNISNLIKRNKQNGCCSNNVICKFDTIDFNHNNPQEIYYNSENLQQKNHNYYNNHNASGRFSGKNCIAPMNSSQSTYYHPLLIESANSSVASSSGCSSSSSVVSSSSSSLSSCDDDHEDLFCDADTPSTSSSASTSSLLDSRTSSVSLESSRRNAPELTPRLNQNELTSNPRYLANSHELDLLQESKELRKLNKLEQLNQQQTSYGILKDGNFRETASKNSKLNDCVVCYSNQQRSMECDSCNFEFTNSSCAVISENFYPTVIGRSEYGNFEEALYHLEKKLIATRSPEEIRGGGLLKYCNLLVKNYKPTNVYQIRTLERYMCSRFFIDFSDLSQQQAKLESYLANHFPDDPVLKFDYLTILHNVVQRSTVCLMNHELRLTLNMIRDLAYKLSTRFRQLYANNRM